ncbi:hypothetical protein IQ37_14390 [Chryseobacterium piperi]|uniref:DUF3575 domain-containing protein n=1 Tax=Chryseobacterium piperi TaxID=558152 RepID=A0A086B2T2_9FLAO|nr:DUF3575 domain-containing protein [Chryseobacterium piperi]ASW76305.1 DUF3575 domain-containing protein [Chryseobacterium piperi]KFF23246.1 hypothetical protein IQ37_14390 [Chryseobacterium piperi]
MKYKILISILTLFSLGKIQAQEQGKEKNLYVKGNALFLPIGIVNAGVEYQLSKKYTLQGDIFISPWKSFGGHELQYYSASVEGRYYFDEAFKHWYVGANLAVSSFVLQKWNYWNSTTYTNANNEKFIKSNLYQKGYSVLLGVTAGYQFKLAENWNMDVYAAIGTSQDFYKGYDRTSGKRYDAANGYNKSGEILPYRGGIMISYKIK